eukprot:8305003-Pyramimonas_sp.AAC.1
MSAKSDRSVRSPWPLMRISLKSGRSGSAPHEGDSASEGPASFSKPSVSTSVGERKRESPADCLRT